MPRTCTVAGCTHQHAARGFCQTHYYHWRKTATDVKPQLHKLYPDPVDRFWAQVDAAGDGCWEFTGTRFEDGYGMITWDGRQQGAHRISWIIANGPIPTGLVVRHRCDNPPCVRPDHLELGTVRDNCRDMWERGNPQIPHLRGSKQNGAKLTEAQIPAIRAARTAGMSVRVLAEQYGVSMSTIYKIGQGKRWQHLDEASA